MFRGLTDFLFLKSYYSVQHCGEQTILFKTVSQHLCYTCSHGNRCPFITHTHTHTPQNTHTHTHHKTHTYHKTHTHTHTPQKTHTHTHWCEELRFYTVTDSRKTSHLGWSNKIQPLLIQGQGLQHSHRCGVSEGQCHYCPVLCALIQCTVQVTQKPRGGLTI